MKSETADDNEVVGSLVGANDSCSVIEGVTLLKGRRVPEIVGGRRERDGQEEVSPRNRAGSALKRASNSRREVNTYFSLRPCRSSSYSSTFVC